MRKLFTILAVVIATAAHGGMKWAAIGVNGLTCSMCTRSVEMSLMRLEFVDSVVMNLDNAEGKIYFKNNAVIEFHQLAKAVVNAGFSVRFVRLHMNFDDITINESGIFVFQEQSFQWLNFDGRVKGDVLLTLVDQIFLPKKEGAQWKKKFTFSRTDDQNILHVIKQG